MTSRFWVLPLATIAWLALLLPLRGTDYWTRDAAFSYSLESPNSIGGVVLPIAYPGGKVVFTTSYDLVDGKEVLNHIGRLNADGSLDLTFQSAATTPLLAYADGSILAMASTGGYAPFQLQRLRADGSVDPAVPVLSIDAADSYSQRAILLADGRTLVFGRFSTVGTAARVGLVILKADGTVDPTFSSPFSADLPPDFINDVAQASDGKIVVAGRFYQVAGVSKALARLQLNGAFDSTFDAGNRFQSSTPARIFPQSAEKIVVSDGNSQLVRLNSNGSVDSSFVPALVGSPNRFGPARSDGKIYYVTYTYVGSSSVQQLRLMDASGVDDPSFTGVSTPSGSAYSVGSPVLSIDDTYIQGALTQERYASRIMLSRVSAAGVIDSSYRPRFARQAVAEAYALQADGKILVAGTFDFVNNVATGKGYSVVRLLPNGATDSSFTAAVPSGSVSKFLVQPSGKVILVGFFANGAGGTSYAIRLNSDGTRDLAFADANENFTRLLQDQAGFLYFVGNGINAGLRRTSPDGQADSSFAVGIPAGSGVDLVAPLEDGSILASTVGPLSYEQKLVRLLHNGSVDPAFHDPEQATMLGMTALPGGGALVCRVNYQFHGPSLSLTRLQSSGVIDYRYNTPVSTSNLLDTAVQLAIGGVMFDLLSASTINPNAQLVFETSPVTGATFFTVRNDGRLLLLRTGSFGSPLIRYVRSELTSPSVNPALAIISYSPGVPVVPLNGTYFSGTVAVSGLGPFTYGWRKDGVVIPGETTPFLFIPHVTSSDAGTYTLVISNNVSSVTTPANTLTVDSSQALALIVSHPASQGAPVGYPTTFTVAAMGSPPITYRWGLSTDHGANWNDLSDSATYAGTATDQLRITTVTAGMDGYQFRCIVGNSVTLNSGSYSTQVASDPAVLTAIVPVRSGGRSADFNGDDKPDLLWSNSVTGERAIWLMNGTNFLGASTLGNFPLEWTIAATADFNADGKTDIIWSNSITGERAIWLMNGTNLLGTSTLGVFPLEWTVAATADFNADGKPDIIWSNSITGERAIWLMNGTNFLAASTLGVFPLEWTVAATGDFNADGKPDIIWSNSITGERAIWLMNGTNFLAASTLGVFPLEWTVAGTADFNADGKPDIIWSNSVTGERALWLMNGTSFLAASTLGIFPLEWTVSN